MITIILAPHEDCDYDSKEAVLADYNDNKMFINVSTHQHYRGDYVTKQDLEKLGCNIKFIFNRCTMYFYL
jgi:hypothetical protein